MYCTKCGAAISEGGKFCESCGAKVSSIDSATPHEVKTKVGVADDSALPTVAETKAGAIVKCGNCGYIGPGEPARSMVGKVLAWICVVFAPLITIIYFVATHKYRCPKCGSTFLGIKNEKGEFTKGQGGASRVVSIIVAILVGIAIMGILSAIVLASLSTARAKGDDAAIESDLSTIQTEAEIYYGGAGSNSYGISASDCTSGMFGADSTIASAITSANNAGGSVVCNSIAGSMPAYAVQAILPSQTSPSQVYTCVDSMGQSTTSSSPLGSATACP